MSSNPVTTPSDAVPPILEDELDLLADYPHIYNRMCVVAEDEYHKDLTDMNFASIEPNVHNRAQYDVRYDDGNEEIVFTIDVRNSKRGDAPETFLIGHSKSEL